MKLIVQWVISFVFLVSTVVAEAGNNYPFHRREGEGQVKGKVVDKVSKESVAFATVSLLKKDSTLVGGVVADENGGFSIPNVAPGNYLVRVTFVGYSSRVVEDVKVATESADTDLGLIALTESSQNLNEVVVRGEKTMIINDLDRKIVNVGKDLLATSSNVSELLEKVPAVSLDENGNPQLRGKGNVVVLIDGKPSSVYGNDLPTVLQSFPADLIERIDVMTTPSAKYEGEGASGVIDIITKKNRIRGISGGVRASLGNQMNNAGSGYINYKEGKWGVRASASAQNSVTDFRRELNRTNFIGEGTTYLSQTGDGSNTGKNLFGRMGVDYELNSKNNLSAVINYSSYRNGSESMLSNLTRREDGEVIQQFDRSSVSETDGGTFNANLDYRHLFREKDHVFTFTVNYSKGESDGRSDFDQKSESKEFIQQQYSLRNGGNTSLLLVADYAWPITPKATLEVGVRSRMNDKNNENQFFTYSQDSASFILDPNISNLFGYKDALNTAYMSFTQKSDKWGIRGGLRMTDATQDINQINQQRQYSIHFLTLVPTLALTRKLSEEAQVRLNYSRTVQRPQAEWLNPFVDVSDPRNVRSGNPDLRPEFIHKAEIGYSNYQQKGGWGPSVFVNYSNNAITNLRTIDAEGISYTRFDNVGRELSYGFESDFSTRLTEKIKVNASGRVFRNEVVSMVANINNQAWSYSGNLNAFFELPFDLRASAYLNYEGPRAIAQGTRQGVFVANMGLRKDLLERKATLSFSFQDLFLSRIYKNELSTETYMQNSLWQRTNRFLNVTFQYKFGKITGSGEGDGA